MEDKVVKDISEILGILVISAALYAIPVLIVCSFFLDWDEFIKLILCIIGLLQFVFTISFLYDNFILK